MLTFECEVMLKANLKSSVLGFLQHLNLSLNAWRLISQKLVVPCVPNPSQHEYLNLPIKSMNSTCM